MAQLGAEEVRVPLEALSYRFRKLQKHLSKEVEAEIKNIRALTALACAPQQQQQQQQTKEEACSAIRGRLDTLRLLTADSAAGERLCVARLQTRAAAVASKQLTPEDRTMILVADYLLRLGEFGCVAEIIAEYGPWLADFLDVQEHREAHAVEAAIRSGQ
jgi:hypothetical protein